MSESGSDRATMAVQASYVASLFNNPSSLLTGAFLQCTVALLCYSETRSPFYLILMVGMLATALWRFSLARTFAESDPEMTEVRVISMWERRQLIALSVGSLLVGIFGFLGVYGATGEFSALAAAIAVMSAGSSLLGKYYASRRLTTFALICLLMPFMAGLFAYGDIKHIIQALLAIPFIAMLSSLATQLRETLFESARGRVLLAEIADRFNTALNNMPQGLVMIDEAQRIEVINRQMHHLLDLPAKTRIEGRGLGVIFTLARRRGLFASRTAADSASAACLATVLSDNGDAVQIPLANERELQITSKRRANGGAVLMVEDITERVKAERQIARMARFDEMTDLQNRAYFKENVNKVLEQGGGSKGLCALYVIDVDDFKTINDTYGHLVGDELLIKLSEKLATLSSNNIIVARHGGDEFAVFASHLADAAAAERLAKRVARTLNSLYALSACAYRASVSIGYSIGEIGTVDHQTLMIRADLALYARKADKSVPFRLYEEELDQRQRDRLKLKTDLGAALRSKSLHLVYQPVVDLDRHRLVSTEALVRWTHPELGPISPGVFVPLAEEMGIVGDLTRFVVRDACLACASWPENLSVSVNLSAIDFDRTTLAAEIFAALETANLDPRRLEVEITETAAIKNHAVVSKVLGELRSKGVRVALDDFGVGYSGLSHLHSLPLDRVKIDRSFILAINDDERSMRLLTSVVSMAQALDLAVTVEGVEDGETLAKVAMAGRVQRVQGFVFGAHHTARQIRDLADHVYAAPDVSRKVA